MSAQIPLGGEPPAADPGAPVVSCGVCGASNPGRHAIAFVARAPGILKPVARAQVLPTEVTTPVAWKTALAWARRECARPFPVVFRVRDQQLARAADVTWARRDPDMDLAHEAARKALEGSGS